MVAQRMFEADGSLGGGIRLLVVDTAGTGRPVGAFPDAYLDALEARGWRRPTERAAISDRTGACVTVDSLSNYLADRGRPDAPKRWLRSLDRLGGSTAVITTTFC